MKKVLKVVWNLLKSLFYAMCIAGLAGLFTWGNLLLLSNWGPYWYLGYLGVAAVALFIAMCWVDRITSQEDTNEVHDEDLEDVKEYKESLKVLDELDKQLIELENKRAKMNKE